MTTSDEDLQKKADEVQSLREQVVEEDAKRTEREADASNEMTMLQLETEEAKLRARLVASKASNKAATGKGGDASITSAEDALVVAVAQQNAAEAAAKAEVAPVPSNKNGGN